MTIAHSLGIGPAGPTDLQQIVIARMDGPDHTLKFYAGFRNPDFEWQATPVLIKVDDGVPFQLHCVVIRGDCFFNKAGTNELATAFNTTQTSVKVQLQDIYDFTYDTAASFVGTRDIDAAVQTFCVAVKKYVHPDGAC